MTSLAELIPILQTAIGPMILISGVGLLMLTMTNRLARVIDRTRALSRQLASATPAEALLIERELCAAILIILIFFTAVLRLEVAWLMAALFVACMARLISGLIAFIVDINLSLEVLALELKASGFNRC